MSWTEPLAADHAQLLVTAWIDRMKAPPPDPSFGPVPDEPDEEESPLLDPDRPEEVDLASGTGLLDDDGQPVDDDLDLTAVTGSWWRRGALLGAVLGMGIGLVVFFSFGTSNPAVANSDTQATVDAIARPVISPAALPAMEPPVQSSTGRAVVEEPPQEEEHQAGSKDTQAIRKPVRKAPGSSLASLPLSDERPREMASQYRRLLRRGWRAYDRGDFQAATNAFARAVHSWPARTGGYFGMALSLFEQGAEDGAMQVLERGVKKVGPKAGLWVLAGSIYQFKGKDRLARMAYKRYLHNNPRGRYARDVRVILSYEQLPRLLPFEADPEEANQPSDQ